MTWHPSPGYVERMERRNGHILELWQMGWSKKQIAAEVDLTPTRVGQVIMSFGIRERERRR